MTDRSHAVIVVWRCLRIGRPDRRLLKSQPDTWCGCVYRAPDGETGDFDGSMEYELEELTRVHRMKSRRVALDSLKSWASENSVEIVRKAYREDHPMSGRVYTEI